MDLDELIASLQAAAGIPAPDAPLIAVDTFVPLDSKDLAADTDASRRMVAAFAYWLAAYGKVASDVPPGRAGTLTSIMVRPDLAAKVIEKLGD